jgi:pre-mRNA-processing factor 8
LKQQQRIAQLARWKAAEEITSLIRALPPEEQPKSIISTRELLLNPLQMYLSEFPNLSIKESDMFIPIPAFMKIPKMASVVTKSPEPKMVLFNMYDNWLEIIPPYHAFSRLMLIMRALLVGKHMIWDILRPNASVVTLPEHLWPSLGNDEWTQVEIKLRDLIVDDYCKKIQFILSQ